MAAPAFRPLLLPLLVLAGCAAEGPFPSLQPRPVEKLSMDEPVREVPVVAADLGLAARTAELLAEARRGQREFEAVLPAARARVRAAGAAASESWIEAQQAVSRLEAARALTVTALAQLDELAIERAARPTNAGQFQALLAAQEAAEELAQSQQAEIARLQAALRPV